MYLAGSLTGLRVLEPQKKFAQKLGFTLPSGARPGSEPIRLVATSSSGLPVDFSVRYGPAKLVAGELIITGIGPVEVRASQAGDATFLPSFEDRVITGLAAVSLAVTFQPAEGNLVLSWSPSGEGFELQKAATLTGGPWTLVTNLATATEGGFKAVVLPHTDPSVFFRLRKP